MLTVRGNVVKGERIIGSIGAQRTVSFGGVYTIGAWKSIFGSIAKTS